MTPKLTAITGPLAGSVFPLAQAETTLGREPGNHLLLPDPLVSRRHCRLAQVAEGGHTLTDLSSVNGTFVNGVPVKERHLAHGDLIRAGESLLLFETEASSDPLTSKGLVQWEKAPMSEAATLTLACEAALDWNAERLHQLSLNARLAQEFRALLRCGLELNTLRTPEGIQQRLLTLLRQLVPAERGVFLLREQAEWEFGCGFGWDNSARALPAACVSHTIVQRVGQESVALLYHNVPTQTELQQAQSLLHSGVQSVLAVPLLADKCVFAILYLDTHNPAAQFDAWHLQVVTALANLTAQILQRARELQAAEAETQRLQAELSRALVGESAPLQQVRIRLAQFAPTDASVLILGESGTGKEVVAQALHQQSSRATKPFIAINCATLTDTLLESELFGHEKGAFTGANTLKKGKLELAAGGTVFLDEIGELKPELQAKLLRVLEERQCERVGGTRPISLDIRVLAATNRDLVAAIKDGSFRADLYHRLNVFTLTLPPLRERREDIELLARFFINRFAQKTGRRVHGLAPTTSQCLQNYDWPGNVRELRNAIEYAVTLNTTGIILPEDLPARIYEAEPQALPSALPLSGAAQTTAPLGAAAVLQYREAIKTARKQIILQAFQQSGGNHQVAAQLLGLHPNNLHREIRLLKLREQLRG